MFRPSTRSFDRDTLRSFSNSFWWRRGLLEARLSGTANFPCGLPIRVCSARCHSSTRHHELAGALHHTPDAALLHRNHHQRMVRWNGAGVACRSTLHAVSRLLLCTGKTDAGVKFRQLAIYSPVLIISSPRLLGKCSTAEGREGTQGRAR